MGLQLLDEALKILIPSLATLLAGWFAYLGNKLKNTYQKTIENETAKSVIKDVVRFIEQVYTDAHGKEKLQKAIEQASDILQSKGINITDMEIMMLIESAVYGLNEGLTSDLKEALKDIKADTKLLTQAIEIDEESSDEEIQG